MLNRELARDELVLLLRATMHEVHRITEEVRYASDEYIQAVMRLSNLAYEYRQAITKYNEEHHNDEI